MNAALSAKGTSRSTRPKAKQIRLKAPFSVDEPRYLLGQVAAAAGITADLLKTWIARKVIVLGEHDRDAHGKGSSRVFTLRRALIVAATAQFVHLGMSTTDAGSRGNIEIDLALQKAKDDPLRIEGFTIFYLLAEKRLQRFFTLDQTLTVAELLKNQFDPGGEAHAGFMLFSRKAVVERVLRQLGELDEVMDTKRT
jgi:hypothetical protein